MGRTNRYEYTDWKNFGKRVKTYRKQIGITNEKFAEMINRSENYLNELEKGNNSCSVHTLHQISKALKVPVDSLLYGEIADMKEEYANKDILLNIIERCNSVEIETIKDVIISLYPHLKEVTEKKNSNLKRASI